MHKRCSLGNFAGFIAYLRGWQCSWAAKVETGKFLPAEILAIVHGYISLDDDDEEDLRESNIIGEIYDGSGRFGVDSEDERYGYD